MNNFSDPQRRKIMETAAKLDQIAYHPAHTFLVKTYSEILDQYELLRKFNLNRRALRPEVFWIQKSYMLNMLAALNHRIDSILRERSI